MILPGFSLLLSSILLASAIKQPHLTAVDKETLKSVFNSGFSKGFVDVQSVYLSVKGSVLLEEIYPHAKEACNLFKSTFRSSEKLHELHAAVHGASLLKTGDCVLTPSESKGTLADVGRITNIESLYLTTRTLRLLGLDIDVEGVKKTLDGFLKKDSSALSQAYSFNIAVDIVQQKEELKKYFVEIEDAIQQADEADNVYMYYDDGVYTTAFILNGILELATKYGAAPPIAVDKLMKFSNFLLARRYTAQLRTAVELTAALKAISRNDLLVPLVASLGDSAIVHKSRQPKLQVAITNLWGDRIAGVRIVADTVKNVLTAVTVMTKQPLVASDTEGVYELDLSAARDQLTRGFYAVKLDVRMANETASAGVAVAPTLLAKVVADVRVDGAELSIKERDQLTGSLNYKLTSGAPLADKLAMNWHHRLDMKFTLRDTDDQPARAHQVFVKATHVGTRQEIIFVVEPDRSDVYKFSLVRLARR